MSTELGERLQRNELSFADQYSRNGVTNRKTTSWWCDLFTGFSFTGDLISYIRSEKSTKALTDHEALFEKYKYPTMKKIVDDYIASHPGCEKQTIAFSNLERSHRYTRRDICSLARNQNENIGMYCSKDSDGRTCVIVKATIGGDKSRRSRYPDEWLDQNHTRIKYCLEKESDTENYEFHKPGNRLIFDGLICDLPVPIYLFANNPGEKDYCYYGKYQANSLASDRKSFNLVLVDRLRDDCLDDCLLEYSRFLVDYRKSDFKKIAKETKPLFEMKLAGKKKLTAQPGFKHPILSGNPDYLQLQERQKLIGNFGEEKVLQFEKKRVGEFAPELVDRIRKVDQDSEGFDIESFDRGGVNGPRSVKIEVKTTTNSNGLNPFFMSSNEKRFMDEHKDEYWLYRVFNIHSTKPSVYRLGTYRNLVYGGYLSSSFD